MALRGHRLMHRLHPWHMVSQRGLRFAPLPAILMACAGQSRAQTPHAVQRSSADKNAPRAKRPIHP